MVVQCLLAESLAGFSGSLIDSTSTILPEPVSSVTVCLGALLLQKKLRSRIPVWLHNLLADLRCRCCLGLFWHLVCGQLVALPSHRRGGSPLPACALPLPWARTQLRGDRRGVPTAWFCTWSGQHHVRTRGAWSSPGSAFLLGMEPLRLLLLV